MDPYCELQRPDPEEVWHDIQAHRAWQANFSALIATRGRLAPNDPEGPYMRQWQETLCRAWQKALGRQSQQQEL